MNILEMQQYAERQLITGYIALTFLASLIWAFIWFNWRLHLNITNRNRRAVAFFIGGPMVWIMTPVFFLVNYLIEQLIKLDKWFEKP